MSWDMRIYRGLDFWSVISSCVYVCTCMYVCMMCVCMYMCMSVCMHVCVYVCVCMYVCMWGLVVKWFGSWAHDPWVMGSSPTICR